MGFSNQKTERVLVTKLMAKNHVWNGFLGVDNYSKMHSNKTFLDGGTSKKRPINLITY